MRFLFTVIFLFSASIVFAQQKIISISFMKDNGKLVTNRDSADYFHFVSVPDSGSSLFNVAEYYRDGTKKLLGKSSKVDPPVYEGQRLTFYKSGKKQSVIRFKNGIPVGDEYDFFPNGRLYQMKEYPDNGDRNNEIEGNYLIKANYDSVGTALVENGRGYYKGYDDKFSYIGEEGPVKDGKRDNVWKGVYKLLDITYTENYKDGLLIDGSSVGKDGKIINYTKRGIPPQFKGGLSAFSNYLMRSVKYPSDARENNIQGRVIVSFVVEKDGKVSDVVASQSVSPSIDAEAVRVIKQSPRWEPGIQYGRQVRVMYSVPIGFNLSEN
jgi:TonB family protein